MKIGIDARLIGETGVGRYIRNLIRELAIRDTKHSYTIFVRQKRDAPTLPSDRWEVREANVRWHTFKEQVVLPRIFSAADLDVLHVPYFNVPVLYTGTMVVTMHDLTIDKVDTGKASTLPRPFYMAKRMGYKTILHAGLRKAHAVLAVSEATKNELMDHYHVDDRKITVTHEGVDENIPKKLQGRNQKALIDGSYLLYVGNAYPHKNVEKALRGFEQVASNHKTLSFVLVGRDDYFYQRLRSWMQKRALASRVIFFGEANDQQLANLYMHAEALVFPSRMEGFGLPGLEAMSMKLPVIASDIPVFQEVYGDGAAYFDPSDERSIAQAMENVLGDQSLRKTLIANGSTRVKRYSWKKMAEETLRVYELVRR